MLKQKAIIHYSECERAHLRVHGNIEILYGQVRRGGEVDEKVRVVTILHLSLQQRSPRNRVRLCGIHARRQKHRDHLKIVVLDRPHERWISRRAAFPGVEAAFQQHLQQLRLVRPHRPLV